MNKLSLSLQTAFLALMICLTAKAWGMSFERQERCLEGLNPRCQSMILAVGQIDKDTPEQFKVIAKDFPRGGWVALSSPGGNLIAGMQLGMVIRDLGLNTTIGNTDFSPPDCSSACAYAFLGGISRKLTPGSRYGLHQFRGTDKAINAEETQKLSAALGKYLDIMGVERRLLDYAQMTSSDRVTFLSLSQAQMLKVDTAGQSSYPRWRVEATADSKLLAVNNGLFTVGSEIPVMIAMMPISNQANQIACLIFYKSTDAGAFNRNNPHRIQIGKDSYPLEMIGGWQEKTKGFQASFLVTDKLQTALMQAPDDAVLTLIGEFSKPPSSNSLTNHSSPTSSPLMTYFGVGNLRTSLQALLKRQ
jgi:hypothetical protein